VDNGERRRHTFSPPWKDMVASLEPHNSAVAIPHWAFPLGHCRGSFGSSTNLALENIWNLQSLVDPG